MIDRILLLMFIGLIAACDSTPKPQVLSGQTMGTTFSVALYQVQEELPLDDIQIQIKTILDGVEAIASTYRDDSEVLRFNASRTSDWQGVSDEFCHMVDGSLVISRETGGAFDVSVGPLVDIWGFGAAARQDETPNDAAIDAALQLVGHDNLDADCERPAIRKLNPAARLDLSAWAKGHAADQVASYLESIGLENYMVEVGGELQLGGGRVNKEPFRIALEHPASGEDLTYEVFAMTNTGVATSGDYHNYYEANGERFSHTIDPRTGRPVTHTLSTVSVISHSTADADAYATALLVMGPENGYAFAVENGIAAYMTEYSGDGVETRATPAFNRRATPIR